MKKLSPSWQDLSDEQWQEACRREAVIRPLAEQDAVSRQATAAAAEQLGIGPARRRVGNRATWLPKTLLGLRKRPAFAIRLK